MRSILSGVYTVHMSLFDVGIVLTAGLLGYFMRYFGYPFLPAVLGVVLGNLVESNYRRSLVLSGGDLGIFSRRSDRRRIPGSGGTHRDGVLGQRMAHRTCAESELA